MQNPYSDFRVTNDAKHLLDIYREQAHELLIQLYNASEILWQSGQGELIGKARYFQCKAGEIEDLINDSENEDEESRQ